LAVQWCLLVQVRVHSASLWITVAQRLGRRLRAWHKVEMTTESSIVCTALGADVLLLNKAICSSAPAASVASSGISTRHACHFAFC
jgi:hypothetical protein